MPEDITRIFELANDYPLIFDVIAIFIVSIFYKLNLLSWLDKSAPDSWKKFILEKFFPEYNNNSNTYNTYQFLKFINDGPRTLLKKVFFKNNSRARFIFVSLFLSLIIVFGHFFTINFFNDSYSSIDTLRSTFIIDEILGIHTFFYIFLLCIVLCFFFDLISNMFSYFVSGIIKRENRILSSFYLILSDITLTVFIWVLSYSISTMISLVIFSNTFETYGYIIAQEAKNIPAIDNNKTTTNNGSTTSSMQWIDFREINIDVYSNELSGDIKIRTNNLKTVNKLTLKIIPPRDYSKILGDNKLYYLGLARYSVDRSTSIDDFLKTKTGDYSKLNFAPTNCEYIYQNLFSTVVQTSKEGKIIDSNHNNDHCFYVSIDHLFGSISLYDMFVLSFSNSLSLITSNIIKYGSNQPYFSFSSLFNYFYRNNSSNILLKSGDPIEKFLIGDILHSTFIYAIPSSSMFWSSFGLTLITYMLLLFRLFTLTFLVSRSYFSTEFHIYETPFTSLLVFFTIFSLIMYLIVEILWIIVF